jgi:hypothetical protein
MTAFRRRLDGVAGKLLPAAPPDLTGWTVDQVLLWAAGNGLFEELVAKANEGGPPKMVTPEERDAELPAVAPVPGSTGLAAEPPPAGPETEHALGRGPGEPLPEPKWYDGMVRWRHRRPEDYYWDRDKEAGYFCESEYDVLERGRRPWDRNEVAGYVCESEYDVLAEWNR